jgi:hypothetical protein
MTYITKLNGGHNYIEIGGDTMYNTSFGFLAYVNGKLMLFASEEEYEEYIQDSTT